jgi:RNA polymerase sigma factor (sigma-70 family)
MRHDDTAIGGAHAQFPSTRPSLFASPPGAFPADALDRVAALYWKPVYCFVRLKFGKDNEDAKDLTQSFFATALERGFFLRFDPSKGSFRNYLRMAVERFAANQHAAAGRQKRGGDCHIEPLDDRDVAAESPEQIFEQEWRRQLFAIALQDLQACAEREGKQLQWAIFQAYDLAEGSRPSYLALAAQHRIAETSVTNHLAWARRKLRGFVNERLRGVTAGESELRKEMRRLWT